MSDPADIAADYIEHANELSLANRVRFEGVSRTHCLECEAEIPQRRRELLAGVELCVDCQFAAEKQKGVFA